MIVLVNVCDLGKWRMAWGPMGWSQKGWTIHIPILRISGVTRVGIHVGDTGGCGWSCQQRTR